MRGPDKGVRTMHYEDIATGPGEKKLRIAGRPRQGSTEKLVLLEEPGKEVQMHYAGKLVPHYKRDCPNCGLANAEPPKPFWYVGGMTMGMGEPVIVELTETCFRGAEAGARNIACNSSVADVDLFGEPIGAPAFTGLIVHIIRQDFDRSPRVLRAVGRASSTKPWPFDTRRELAKIWGIVMRPKIWRSEA